MSYLWCLILWIVCVKFGLLLICSVLADWLLFVLILVSLIVVVWVWLVCLGGCVYFCFGCWVVRYVDCCR